MIDIISTISAVLLLVIIGHMLRFYKFVQTYFWDDLSKICYWILFPCLLFNLTSTLQLNSPFLLPLSITILVGAAFAILYGLLCGRLLGANGPTTSTLIQAGLRYNAFLMLAFVQGAFGLTALKIGAMTVAIFVPLANVMSVLMIFLLRDDKQTLGLGRAIVTEVARNPLVVAVALGICVNLLYLPIPTFIHETGKLVGGASLPMLLLCVGASIRITALKAHKAALLLAVISKLFILPVVMVLTGMFLGLNKEILLVLVVMATVPTAASSYTLAQQLGGDAPLMAEIITAQTIVSAIAIPVWVVTISVLL